ncbi:MAG TPA: GGDEF domain-containing protein [Longimicrobium sp.]
MSQRVILHFSPHGRPAPAVVRAFAEERELPIVEAASAYEVQERVGRAYPAALVLDASPGSDDALRVCQAVKGESFTSVVPVIMYLADNGGGAEAAAVALEAGADEVLGHGLSERECGLRLRMALRRAERDVSVHPTTLLPGTVQIERDIAQRLRAGDKFAVCYADLDHFKEFNDRYGYNNGDRVILILSRILRDVVRAHSQASFVGHIGGDDFIFNAPLSEFRRCCEDAIAVFSELIPLHYAVEDRERGFFIGKDRRGEEYEVPLMTLSIGVVTNEHRTFVHTAQISELATEMKAYAKTFSGSIYVVDRRHGGPQGTAGGEGQ